MKTKILIISSLIIGGLLFSSCQKDNALIEETSFEQLSQNKMFLNHQKLAHGAVHLVIRETLTKIVYLTSQTHLPGILPFIIS